MEVKKSRAEKIESLQKKANELLAWFEGKDMPAPPFLLSQGETCIDPEKMVYVALTTLDTYADNPFAKPFVSAYLRLNNLKIFIERATTKSAGSKRGKRAKPANAGN
jgi:hypothetical protein